MVGFRHMRPNGCCNKEPGNLFGDAFPQSIKPPENTQPNFIEGLSGSSTINIHKPHLSYCSFALWSGDLSHPTTWLRRSNEGRRCPVSAIARYIGLRPFLRPRVGGAMRLIWVKYSYQLIPIGCLDLLFLEGRRMSGVTD